jgi:acetyl-CoA carboxylase carboxyltransferase component
VRFRQFDRPWLDAARERARAAARVELAALAERPDAPDAADRIKRLVAAPLPVTQLLVERPVLEVFVRRVYGDLPIADTRETSAAGQPCFTAVVREEQRRLRVVATVAGAAGVPDAAKALAELATGADAAAGELLVIGEDGLHADAISRALADASPPPALERVSVTAAGVRGAQQLTFRRNSGGFVEDRVLRGLHPVTAARLRLGRLANFELARLPSVEDVHVFHCIARDNPADERVVAVAEIADLTPVLDADGLLIALPELERVLDACLDGIRRFQTQRPSSQRLHGNRVLLSIRPVVDLPRREIVDFIRQLAPRTIALGLEEVLVEARVARPGGSRQLALRFAHQPGAGITVGVVDPPTEPLPTLDAYAQKVLQARRRGTVYPYELVPLLAGPEGSFVEHDLDEDGQLVAVERPVGQNRSGIVVGLVRTPTTAYPDGIVRVAILGDPTRALGAIAEPEARRVLGALALAQRLRVPVEWFAVSAGAKISFDSGTENMDWVARVLRELVHFTQVGGEVNVIVAAINVGAQPYWNAEATMLMHTRGILVMTPDSAMVLTGKQALDYSGGVSAEDNFGIGGYHRIMGPNGQAQYWAHDLVDACEILHAHYDHSYVSPGERFPRRKATTDPIDRDACAYPHAAPGTDFATVGEIFSADSNPERKKPFDIRTLMRATIDQDRQPLERWVGMADADTAVVFDAHLGGRPVTLVGIESRPLARHGFLPTDGPSDWSAGTLFPRSSKKVARAINAASGNQPLVVLANLSGFDGSPESLRKLQLEYGAEIGRAVVNFQGPIVFCVVSRYHGGAFVVFSAALNDSMEVVALEGSHASVIGGAPAAAVVFSGEVNRRTDEDPRVRDLEAAISEATDDERARLRAELAETRTTVRLAMLGEVAAEFDEIHSVDRAVRVGSVHVVIPAQRLRPYLVDAVERGIRRVLDRTATEST